MQYLRNLPPVLPEILTEAESRQRDELRRQKRRRKNRLYRKRKSQRSKVQQQAIDRQGGLFEYDKLSEEQRASKIFEFGLSTNQYKDRAGHYQSDLRCQEIKENYEANGHKIDEIHNSISSGKGMNYSNWINHCKSAFSAFDVLFSLYSDQEHLRFFHYSNEQAAMQYFLWWFIGNREAKDIVVAVGSARFGKLMKGTVSGPSRKFLKLLSQTVGQYLCIDEFKTTDVCHGCFGTGRVCEQVDCSPSSCPVNVDIQSLFDEGKLNLAYLESVLREMGISDVEFSELETDDDTQFGKRSADEDEIDIEDREEIEGEDVEEKEGEDDCEGTDNRELVDSHFEIVEGPSNSAPDVDDMAIDPGGNIPKPKINCQYWKWEGNGPVYAEGVRRVQLTSKSKTKLLETILKLKKPWRMGWKEDLESMEKRIEAAYEERGIPKGNALRGVKYCYQMWDRDKNAAINISILFWFLRLNGGKRPFAFQRKRSSS